MQKERLKMLGVILKNLKEMKEQGYHFVENEEGDFMRVEHGNTIVQTVGLISDGRLEVRDSVGDVIGRYKSVRYSMEMDELCIRYFNL